MIALTERLIIREFVDDDAASIVALLNDPAFLEFIGDRGVRNLDDARAYMGRVSLKAVTLRDGTFIGICGILQRDWLEGVDIGFAYLSEFRSKGYAAEAARATLDVAKAQGFDKVYAIVDPRNAASETLLQRVGFEFDREVINPENETLKLWVHEFSS